MNDAAAHWQRIAEEREATKEGYAAEVRRLNHLLRKAERELEEQAIELARVREAVRYLEAKGW